MLYWRLRRFPEEPGQLLDNLRIESKPDMSSCLPAEQRGRLTVAWIAGKRYEVTVTDGDVNLGSGVVVAEPRLEFPGILPQRR